MATPATAVPSPAASRTRDWVRTAEPGSAFNGLGRGGRGGGGGGGGRGRNRSGRGRNGSGTTANMSRSPSTSTSVDKPSTGEGSSNPKQAAPPALAPVAEKSNNATTTPAPSRSKGQRKPSRAAAPAIPTVVVGPATPSVEASAPAPRPSNRRRRSQQLGSKGNGNPAASLKVNVPASLDDKLLRPQGRLLPHSAPPPSKDTPPHLAGAFDVRNNIDALVERVRAVAMDNRPSTPGSASHIDWAGDDDEGLPDLDDWGVTTSTADKDEMISPIIVDGLKTLPEPTVKPPTPSGDVKEEAVVPFAMDQKHAETAAPPLPPSLPVKPVTSSSTANSTPVSVSDSSQSPPDPQAKESDADSDSGREGLSASIHAPAISNSLSAPSNLNTAPSQESAFNPTHNRAQTVGRHFPQSAPVNFNSRFSRSGASTPRGGGHQHARTHSSPPAGSLLNHRPVHSRPIITGDAISRLARTIAAPSTRTPPPIVSNI
ncbi:hypothetical protein FB45DRAFT_903377 [Roridomyces roridus]|uniref:Uncharacterized protein n=1 Tax=Roridomyces roridus TaxID=1738132 RepID=A0AAD7C412_9AGAR|nr:hypothetical protein FB45DRAFT_903377 [Roridomyces roridus]